MLQILKWENSLNPSNFLQGLHWRQISWQLRLDSGLMQKFISHLWHKNRTPKEFNVYHVLTSSQGKYRKWNHLRIGKKKVEAVCCKNAICLQEVREISNIKLWSNVLQPLIDMFMPSSKLDILILYRKHLFFQVEREPSCLPKGLKIFIKKLRLNWKN